MSIGEIKLALPAGSSLWEIETSFLEPQFILITPDSRKFHVSTRASHILKEIVDQQKSVSEIASALSEKWNEPVSPTDVLAVVDSPEWPKNMVRKTIPWEDSQTIEEAIEERQDSAQSPYSKFFVRFTLIPARFVSKAANYLSGLYNARLFVALFLPVALAHYLAYKYLFSVPSLVEAFRMSPAQYVGAFALMSLSVLIHEFGHAAASARFKVTPGAIGCGIYFIYPALYTELGFCWLLPRLQRAVVDVGGFYFQLLFAAPMYLAFVITGDPLYIVVILSIDFLVIFSLIPFFKFDGYWLVSDLLGIPNLQKRAMEVLRSPLKVIKSPSFATRNGLTLPRRIAVTLFVYGLFSAVFQTMIAALIFQSGPGFLLHAPARLVEMGKEIISEIARQEYMAATNHGIKALMFAVTAIALIFIFKAYAKLLWKWCRPLAVKLLPGIGQTKVDSISVKGR